MQSAARRTQMPAQTPCLIFNRIHDHRQDIRFMKHPIEKPSKPTMRFFTPELYCLFNSANEEEADRAEEAWESALQAYRNHLEGL
jgi:hypothetical protein